MNSTHPTTAPDNASLLRSTPFIVILGLVNFTLFLLTIAALFIFFWDTTLLHQWLPVPTVRPWWQALLINLGLMTWFNVGHSLLLQPKWKMLVARLVPMGIVPVIYSLHACLSLLLLMVYWQPIGGEIYHLQSGVFYYLEGALYVGSWLFMGYAMLSIGAFRQTGMEQWWRHLKRRSQKFEIPYDGAFKVCRHPIYFAFLGMIWFGHSMTWDHLILGVYWSLYIFYGAAMKEKHMLRNHTYKQYMQRVPPFPFWPRQPLITSFSRLLGLRGPTAAATFVFFAFMLPAVGWGELIKGSKKYQTWNEATMADSSIEFYIESVKMGFIKSKEKGQVMEFSYTGDFDAGQQQWQKLAVKFAVLQMNTNHTARDEKLHNTVIDHRIGPELSVEVMGPVKWESGEQQVPAILHILGKKHPFELRVETLKNPGELLVKGSAVLSLAELVKLGMQDPSIAIAKLSDAIELKFKIKHKL